MKSFIDQARNALRINDPKLVWRFFLAFSRFEYALKCSGYIRCSRNGSVAADWQSFASDHRQEFAGNQNDKVQAACDYFVQRPPRQQTLMHGVLRWRDSHPLGKTPLLCWLVMMVARV